MEDSAFWLLSAVSDVQLRRALTDLLTHGSRTEARIIAHLAEVEERRLHLRDGSESLYAYCIHVLHLSNSEAFHRITTARVARRFPIVFRLVNERALHLTAVCLLRDYLTLETNRELLRAATHKTKAQVEELIACRFPRPDVASRIRKLPAPRATALLASSGESSSGESSSGESSSGESSSGESSSGESSSGESSSGESSSSSGARSNLPAFREVTTASGIGREAGEATPALVAGAPGRPPLPMETAVRGPRPTTGASAMPRPRPVEPISEARYRIQLNASATLKEKLDRLRELTSHVNPTGDIAVLIERALDLAIEQAQKRRFAKTKRGRHEVRRSVRRSAIQGAEVQPTQAESEGVPSEAQPGARGREREHIPNAVVREVSARDEMRCTYVGANGCRCTARAFLQIHHEQSWARGGADTIDNLRLLCAAHNRLLAEQEFGAGYVAERVADRRRRRSGEDEGASEYVDGGRPRL